MQLSTMQILWYLIICISIICYVMLDGFDLGVGCVHLLTKKDEDRRVLLNSIGPVWDGNAVWIVVVGGATFAGFCDAYATVFSGFYLLTMILLCGFIFRAVAIEFRSKTPNQKWRNLWDIFFSVASIIIAFGVGVILGNLITGIPLDADKNYTGTFWQLLSCHSILFGFTAVTLLAMHGINYLVMKTEGELHDRIRKWVFPSIICFLVFYVTTTFTTLTFTPHMIERMLDHPVLFLFPVCTLLAIMMIPYQAYKKRDGWTFIFSCISIAFLFILFGLGTFPNIVRSSNDPQNLSLTIYNSSASPSTLKVLLIIAVIGVPLVLAYGYYIYRIFRGKVKLDNTSY